jgi:hypothetical protein
MKRAAIALGIVAAVLFVPPLVRAQVAPLPGHQVTFDSIGAACHVDFVADASTGEAPPRLRVTIDMLRNRVSIDLSGGNYFDQVFLYGGVRHDFRPVRAIASNSLPEEPFWLKLELAAEQGASIYFTVRNEQEAYSSARYDHLGPDRIARTVALACGLDMPGAIPGSQIEALRTEERLRLSDANVAHIRRVLLSRYGEPGLPAGREPRFTVTDRRLISLFNADKTGLESEYLTAETAAELLAAQPALPQEAPTPLGARQVAEFRDWTLWSEGEGAVCSMSSPVQAATGYAGTIRPVMRFAVERAASGGLMVFELTRPNPFAPGSIVANIDGQRVDLFVEPSTGALAPRPLADGRLSNEFMVRLRQGQNVSIEGIAIDTGQPLSVVYSAFGFTAAFREMARLCNRPGILGWIE